MATLDENKNLLNVEKPKIKEQSNLSAQHVHVANAMSSFFRVSNKGLGELLKAKNDIGKKDENKPDEKSPEIENSERGSSLK